jgi:VanZ family protein
MLPLRHTRRWQVASLLLLLAVLLAAMSPAIWFFDDRASALRWIQNVDKWMHATTFGMLAMWFAGLYRRSAYWRIAVGLMAFGLLVEFCQLQVSYRTADWADVAANTGGIIAGLSLALIGLGGWGPKFEDWLLQRSRR